ncbi:MAG: 4'-phosphopantetheinyl transferase superfamily protein [Bacteroidota bacterium]
MIKLYICENDSALSKEQWDLLLSSLPANMRGKINRLRRWPDRQASLAGKLLLRHALVTQFGSDRLLQLMQLTEYNRPFLPMDGDFNISHTDGLIVCAFSTTGPVGVDVELKKPIKIQEFQRVFTKREWAELLSSSDQENLFFKLWTTKEAVMKADGRGMYLDPAGFDGQEQSIKIEEKLWYVQPLMLKSKWAGHICSHSKSDLQYQYLSFNDLV